MFAHQVVEFSGPAGVVWTELPEPTSRDGVIVDVVAAGVSFADLLQTQGRYQLALPRCSLRVGRPGERAS